MINRYEIHTVTTKNLSEVEKTMQEKGLQFAKELVPEGVVFHIMRSGGIFKVMVELYKKTSEGFEYEFKMNNFEDMKLMNDFLENL